MLNPRIPPINCLLSFEVVAGLRSVTKAATEISATPNAISHRIRQLATHLSQKPFARGDFSPTAPRGDAYLNPVREALQLLASPSNSVAERAKKLTLAVTPTFSRQILLPKLGLPGRDSGRALVLAILEQFSQSKRTHTDGAITP